MALSKLLIAFLSLTSVSTIYLLSEKKPKDCFHACPEMHEMNTERIDRMAERLIFLEGVSEKMWKQNRK